MAEGPWISRFLTRTGAPGLLELWGSPASRAPVLLWPGECQALSSSLSWHVQCFIPAGCVGTRADVSVLNSPFLSTCVLSALWRHSTARRERQNQRGSALPGMLELHEAGSQPLPFFSLRKL